MSDGKALFHADHKNLLTAGAPTADSFSEARKAMQKQKEPSGIAHAINIRPRYVICGPDLEEDIYQLMSSPTRLGQDNPAIRNPVARYSLDAVVDARIEGSAYYFAADAKQFDTIEVSYLYGERRPFLDRREGWNVDGVEYKVRLDAGVKAMDWRGLSKNPGA